jgi:hypothetical protein
MPLWVARNYIAGALLDVDELVSTVDAVLRLGPLSSVPTIAVTPRHQA